MEVDEGGRSSLVTAMQGMLDAPHGPVRERMRRLLASPAFEPASETVRADRAAYRKQVMDWCRQLAREGIGALSLPREHGGADDLGQFIAAFETLAFHDGSLLIKFGVQFGLFAGSILQLGTARHHAAWLGRAATLDLPGCFAMSETLHGSNVAELGTVARYDAASGEFEIHTPRPLDRKDWIGSAAHDGRLATVFAQLSTAGEAHGVHAFLVPIRGADGAAAPGVTLEDCGEKSGLNGVDNGRITFDRVRVPRENLLDRFASVAPDGTYSSPIASPARRFFTMLGTLIGGRISVAAAAVSASKSGLAIALRYGSRRRQFGPPHGQGPAAGTPAATAAAGTADEEVILDYPAHQRRLMPALAATYALDFAHKRLVARFVAHTAAATAATAATAPTPAATAAPADGAEARQIEGLAAGLKAYASWHAAATLQTCRECCGGQGYLVVNRLPLLQRDADIFTTFEGDNTVLMQQVAKGLLTAYREHIANMSFLSLALHVLHEAERAAADLAARLPLTGHHAGEAHLRDPEIQRSLLRLREERLLASVARRIKARLDEGATGTAAFNQVQTHLLALAQAHVERVVLECVGDAAAAAADDVRPTLTLLRDVYALSRLEAGAAWFLETHHMDGAQAKAVRALVDRLCGELRAQALPLVDAWAIPDACLAAPIAFGLAG